jgi:hypothetical protein
MKVRICRVSFTTTSGIRHSAEIQADSLYEAAVEGIKAISHQWGEHPGLVTPIAIEVKAPTTHLEANSAAAGYRSLSPGEQVEFEPVETERGRITCVCE